MNRVFVSSACALTGLIAASAVGGTVTDDLQEIMAGAGVDQPIKVLVYMNEQVDLVGLDFQMPRGRGLLELRHETVITALQDTASASQGALAASLAELEQAGRVQSFEPFWIVNAFRVEASAVEIERIAARPDVGSVYLDYPIESIYPVNYDEKIEPNDVGGATALVAEPGIIAIRAPEAWGLGVTGEGVLVASLDTGVDGNHPALADRWAGTADPIYEGHPEWAWFDPVTNTTFPAAFGGHGTHTMGTVCGGAPGNEVGVAPGAHWIHAAVIDRVNIPTTVSDAILSFEWMVDPDGNPSTSFDVPAVCSNSWGLVTDHGYSPCDPTFWSFIDACEAAGVVVLFSAGNEGFSGLRRPADRATNDYSALAVAAVNGNTPTWPIASFSSRGPTFCTPDGSTAIKPDISAPGEAVRSAWPGGGYILLDGTSMASPHINGVVALIKQACPDLTVDEVKQILYDTAVDLGPSGEDNDYGWGMVDAFEAVNLAFDLCGPSPPRASDASYQTPVGVPLPITLEASDYDGLPGGPLTYRIVSLPAGLNVLTDIGNGHVITAGDLPYDLVNNGTQVTYTPEGSYFGNDSLQFSADDGGSPPDGGEGDPGTVAILVLFDAPLIATTTLPDGYLNQAYGPVQMQADQGQPPLVWTTIEDEYVEADLGSSQFTAGGSPRNWHADDSSWSYTIPFVFPYFAQTYTQVNVCSNGFIDFTSSSSPWTNSDSGLIDAVRIAPMWDDIRTDCNAGDDIYIDEGTPGQVTIRWQGTRYTSSCSGGIVNVAVTLFDDGRIRFHYGGANNSLSPTIGVSAGDGSNYLLSSYNNASSLTNANSLEIYPPSALPDGMVLGEDGALAGTPTEFGSFEPRIRVTDDLGRSDQRQFALEILEAGLPGDITGDGVIGFEDLLYLLSEWGACAGCRSDLDGDGIVGFQDLLLLLSNWT